MSNFKGFGLTTLSVNNTKTVFLIAIVIVIGGMLAYQSMPKENFPELKIPEIYIGIAKPGSSPKYMSEKISQSIEKEVGGIKLVDEINSNSVHGYTTIRVKFDFKMPVDEALQKVKDAVDQARTKSDFPQLPAEPNIFELDPSKMPILNINLRSENASVLKEVSEDLEKQLEELPEISEVDIRGLPLQEMRIEVDPIKAQAVKVTIDDIQNAVSAENQTIPGGEILMDGIRKTVRIEGEYESAEELKRTVIKQDEFLPVYLEDVADVYFGNADTTSFAREFGVAVVMLDVKKQGGENLLVASDKINQIISESQANGVIPKSVEVSLTNDQSNVTRDMVSNLENSIILGIILVVGVLLFFLGLRNALFVGVAIPLSMLMSFLILNAMGITLNVMVLFSLVLALGMLVDNGIVIVENIYRYMDEGNSSYTSVVQGVGEVAWPIISSTATTVAAFVPLALWPGIIGEFMKFLPMTLMIVLASSLFVALVINPVLAVTYMKVTQNQPNKKKIIITSSFFTVIGIFFIIFGWVSFGNLIAFVGLLSLVNLFIFLPGTKTFQNKFLPRLERVYERFLRFAIKGKRPLLFLGGTIMLLVFSLGLFAIFPPKVEFFPNNEPQYVNIFISHPIGTDIGVTNETTLKVEEDLNKILNEYMDADDTTGIPQDERLIKSIISQVGEGTSDPAQGVSMGNTPHKARITVNFCEFQFRQRTKTSDILKKIQAGLKGTYNADIEITAAKNESGPPQGAPINIEVTGRGEYKELIAAAEEIKSHLDRKGIEGVEKLKLNVDANRPEIPITVDRDQIRKLNASTYKVGMAIRKSLLGQDVSTYTLDEESHDIVVRFNSDNRNDLNALLDQRLIFRNNQGKLMNIPVRSVIENPTESTSYSAVVRKDQIPLVTITSNVTEGFNANEVVKVMKNEMTSFEKEGNLKDGIKFRFAGQQDEQAKEMAFLSKALMVALFLVLLIIVSQFNSYSAPTVILLTVLLSLIGVFLGLVISGQNFVVIMTMIGIISLAGVVVNNAIVLIDYTNSLRKRKRIENKLGDNELLSNEDLLECTIQGGKTRLRPVLLTAITTILGLIPLAIGFNIDFVGLFSSYEPNIFLGGDNNMFFAPMAWTIIYGLTFATFLTLIILPAVYLLSYKFKVWLYGVFNWQIKSNF
ncbi:MAG: efflux RND transporter permease subunit [Crocinitomicaceae bacterium]|nr:efflux RND transporter permease subunit [Crocinitomicaceae bacterium]MDG1735129.1 efflux RND transporter permease subunit [Crocinitomicaceae bacterium]MDG2506313.1 efflux RND transporter permease subunit [Crocinitomicaceae bacterium]